MRDSEAGPSGEGTVLGERLARRMLESGAGELLDRNPAKGRMTPRPG